MTLRSSLLLTFRLLFPRTGKKSSARRSLTGALLCIGISLVPLVVVLTVSNGMIQGITERIIGLSSSHIEVMLYPDDERAVSAPALSGFAGTLAEKKDVVSAYAELQGMGLAAGRNGRTGASIRAVPGDIFTKNSSYKKLFTVLSGSTELSLPNSAVIGRKIAKDLGVQCGDTFRLITTRMSASGTIIPQVSVFKVCGIVSCGYQELDALWVFIPLSRGYEILPPESSGYTVKLEVQHPFSAETIRVQHDIQRTAGGSVRVYRWDELNTGEYENFASTKMMLMFIMLLIVLVASVNISSSLIMLAMERRREIAILKSIGGTRNGITLSFLLTGLMTGLGGIAAGIPVGLFFAVNINKIISFTEKTVNFAGKIVYLLKGNSTADFTTISLLDPAYYLQSIPVDVPFMQLFVIGAGTLLLSLAASAVPALRAGAEKPLETLRKI